MTQSESDRKYYLKHREKCIKKAQAYYAKNKEHCLALAKKWRERKKKHRESDRRYYQENKEIILAKSKIYRAKNLTELLQKTRFYNMKNRCGNRKAHNFKYYGGKGIKCLMTYEELKSIWERDNASKLKRPSIDRINPNGHYTFDNCRFVEHSENARRAVTKYARS